MMRVYRAIWLPISVVLGVAGFYLSTSRQPIPVLIVGLALLSAVVVGLHLRHPDWSWSRVPPRLTRWVVVAAAVWSYVGLIRLFGVLAGVVVLGVVAVSPPVLSWAARAVRRLSPRSSEAAPASASTVSGPVVAGSSTPEPPELVDFSQLSNENLCRVWRTSFVELQQLQLLHAVAAQLLLVKARQGYLDELERRDPAGFRRWLAAGARPAGDPSRYITSATPLPTDGALP